MINDKINQFVELNRSMGFKYRIQNCLLQNFALFAQQRGDTYVRCETVLEWANQAPSVAQKRNRLLTVRRFAVVMQAEDRRYEIPPADAFGRTTFKRRIPHIVSSNELNLLLIAAQKLKPLNTIRPKTYFTLFALLAITGLRISEALNLNVEDVTVDGLIVRSTKFRKDRLVPLHDSAQQAIQHYLKLRLKFANDQQALFVSNNGRKLSYPTVNSIFLQLARSIGLRKEPGDHGVHIHDLRHLFAVKSLEQCENECDAISQHMIALSTYLGHAHISDTYWYLHATPLLMKKIALTQEDYYRRLTNE